MLKSHFTEKELKSGDIGMYLVGGYLDEKRTSNEVSQSILKQLIESNETEQRIELKLLFSGELNTDYKHVNDNPHKNSDNSNSKKLTQVPIPKIQCCAMTLSQTEKLLPFGFTHITGEDIPHYTLRSAILYSKKELLLNTLLNVNDKLLDESYSLCLDPFDFECPNWLKDDLFYKKILNCDDSFWLTNFSTSPYAEHPDFVRQIKQLFAFLRTTSSTQAFKINSSTQSSVIRFQNGVMLSAKKDSNVTEATDTSAVSEQKEE